MCQTPVGWAESEGRGVCVFGGGTVKRKRARWGGVKSRPGGSNKGKGTFVACPAHATYHPMQFNAFCHRCLQSSYEADSSSIIPYVDEAAEA